MLPVEKSTRDLLPFIEADPGELLELRVEFDDGPAESKEHPPPAAPQAMRPPGG
jgi:hypothetical protein